MKYLLLDTCIYINLTILENSNTSHKSINLLLNLANHKDVELLIPDIVKNEFKKNFNSKKNILVELKNCDFKTTNWTLLNTDEHTKEKDEITNFLAEKKQKILELNNKYISEYDLKIKGIFDKGKELNSNDNLIMKALKNSIYGLPPCHEKRLIASSDSLIFEILMDFIASDEFDKDKDSIIFITSNTNDFSEKSHITKIHPYLLKRIEQITNKFSYYTNFNNAISKEFNKELLPKELDEISTEENESKFIWPVPSSTMISRYFGSLNNILGYETNAYHSGIDIPAKINDSVVASFAGNVIKAKYSGAYGNMIIIENDEIKTLYAHLNKINVIEGQFVERGEQIGFIGSTGNSTGPHLHFELLINNNRTNPMDYLTLV